MLPYDITPGQKPRSGYAAKLISERFWSHVEKTDGCWLWTGTVGRQGYGVLSAKDYTVSPPKRLTITAHRLAWEIHFGPIPDGLNVCHHCDTRLCVRPHHLFTGTDQDNARDMAQKGRSGPQVYPERYTHKGNVHWARQHPEKVRRGAANNKAALSEEQVREIRRRYTPKRGTLAALAREFHVSVNTITRVVRNQTWRHIV